MAQKTQSQMFIQSTNYTAMKTINLLTVGLLILLLTSCNSKPNIDIEKERIKNRIESESNGLIQLVSFEMTGENETEFFEKPAISFTYKCTIKFNDTCWREGDWSSFHVSKEEPLYVDLMNFPSKFNAGEETVFEGEALYVKKESGWEYVNNKL